MAQLAYALDGPDDAPVLVLASSLGTTRDIWWPQLDALSRRRRVLRFDHPGHGASPIWDVPVTVAGIGRAVLDLLDDLGCDSFSFAGLSLGGAVAQWVAAHAPERVERLILCSTSAYFGSSEVYRERAALARAEGVTAISAGVIERWFTPAYRASQPDVVARVRAMLEATPPEGYAACCEAVGGFDGRPDLPAITSPTLVIAGVDDPSTPVEHAQALCAGIANARLQIIPHAAHLVNVEQPSAVEAAMIEHLTNGIL